MFKRKSSSRPSVDVITKLRGWGAQFQGLNPNDPAVWPQIPRFFLCVSVAVLAVVLLWF